MGAVLTGKWLAYVIRHINGLKARFRELFNTLETLFLLIWLLAIGYRSSGSVE